MCIGVTCATRSTLSVQRLLSEKTHISSKVALKLKASPQFRRVSAQTA